MWWMIITRKLTFFGRPWTSIEAVAEAARCICWRSAECWSWSLARSFSWPCRRSTFIALCMWGIHRVPLTLLGLQLATVLVWENRALVLTCNLQLPNWMQEIRPCDFCQWTALVQGNDVIVVLSSTFLLKRNRLFELQFVIFLYSQMCS